MTTPTMHVIYNDEIILAYGDTRDACLAMMADCYGSDHDIEVEERFDLSHGNYGDGLYWGEATPALAAELRAGGGERYRDVGGVLDVPAST